MVVFSCMILFFGIINPFVVWLPVVKCDLRAGGTLQRGGLKEGSVMTQGENT